MATHDCPRCGSSKATTVMLPAKDSHDLRPHPAYRCMSCDTQWSDEEQWTRLHEEHGDGEHAPDA